ncbi:LOW QUALITY PROTEIN: complement component C7 [Xenentodon cancila]
MVFLSTTRVFCVQRIHCQWGSYGSWSDCDPCTKLQTRSRSMIVYSQFDGNPCNGVRTETRSCETTQGCPLEEGCGGRFRCRSGKCISKSLVCNGDQDCEEDGLDENECNIQKFIICVHTVPPPNIELLGLGFDVVTGERRGSVINTKSFGGQCRSIYSGDHNTIYRLPLSVTQYNFLVKVQNDFSDEMFRSMWHYTKDIVNREKVTGTTTGYRNYDFHESHEKTQFHKLLVLKNDIEVAQFQTNSPNYLTISEEFWRALAKLPSVYDYSAYRKIVERFGTHYVSEGTLGGSFKVVAKIDEETEAHMVSETLQQHECVRTKRWFLIFPITHVDCWNKNHQHSSVSVNSRNDEVAKVDVEGGGVSHITALKTIQLDNPNKNWEMYSNWAESVRSFPQIIKQKLRPLSELVREVQCAGAKRLYLRKAIEQYLAESDPCHCQPCRNNGMVVMAGNKCRCICKPGTSGLACEEGAEVDGQQGVITGAWSCWSAWSSCSVGRRSRSRSCTNPSPQNGGQSCIGEATETSDCEDQELEYFKIMEPQCFDKTLPASQKCETPPPLINGYILNPKDIYLVGSKVEYTCTGGFHLVGLGTIECTADQTWSAAPGVCAVSVCRLQSLNEDVIASPVNQAYMIGDVVALSCPEGRTLQGEATITCDSSLHFSPDPADIRCSQHTQQQQVAPGVQCEVWQKPSKGKCVCKIPHECSSSLELCVASPVGRRFLSMTVCKMHALQCMKKKYDIAEHDNCEWPQRNTIGCTSCHMWEYCDDQTNNCRCKEPADCLTPGLNVCVRVGENMTAATQTMSECEAGVRRCTGEKLSVVSILPCAED